GRRARRHARCGPSRAAGCAGAERRRRTRPRAGPPRPWRLAGGGAQGSSLVVVLAVEVGDLFIVVAAFLVLVLILIVVVVVLVVEVAIEVFVLVFVVVVLVFIIQLVQLQRMRIHNLQVGAAAAAVHDPAFLELLLIQVQISFTCRTAFHGPLLVFGRSPMTDLPRPPPTNKIHRFDCLRRN